MKRLWPTAILFSSAALGQVRPAVLGTDPMHQSVAYAVDQTVILEAAPGFQLTVELDPREQILSAAAGDGASWQISAPRKASQFFVRPNRGAPPTNLTVVTNKHSYYFLLVATQQMTARNALSVRFTYPEAIVTAEQPSNRPKQQSGTYKLTGAHQIRPSLIWDDGEKTYLDWPPGIEAPAIFAIDTSGSESLVNCYLRGGRFVIDDVYARLVFRLDRLSARADRRAKDRS